MRQNWAACEAAGEAHLAAVGAHESSSEDEGPLKHRPICAAEEDAVKLVHTLMMSCVLMRAHHCISEK
jgi:hypothetical protein